MIETPKVVDSGSFAYKDLIGQRDENAPRNNPRTVVASATVSQLDDLILVNASSGALTMTLETAVGCDGRRHAFIKTDATANAMTVDGNGSETINGSATVSRTDQYGVIKVASDGTNWKAEYIGPGTAASNGRVKLETFVHTSDATLTMNLSPYVGLYKTLSIKFENVHAETDDVEFRAITNGASGAGNYGYAVSGQAVGATANNLDASDTELVIAGGSAAGRALGNGAAQALSGWVYLHNFAETTYNKRVTAFGGFQDGGADEPSVFAMTGHRLDTAAVTTVAFYMESGDWSGFATLYGEVD